MQPKQATWLMVLSLIVSGCGAGTDVPPSDPSQSDVVEAGLTTFSAIVTDSYQISNNGGANIYPLNGLTLQSVDGNSSLPSPIYPWSSSGLSLRQPGQTSLTQRIVYTSNPSDPYGSNSRACRWTVSATWSTTTNTCVVNVTPTKLGGLPATCTNAQPSYNPYNCEFSVSLRMSY